MINELEALVGIFIVVIINYMYLWRRSKIIGAGTLMVTMLLMIIVFQTTDYEIVAWVGVGIGLISTITEIAFAKAGKTQS